MKLTSHTETAEGWITDLNFVITPASDRDFDIYSACHAVMQNVFFIIHNFKPVNRNIFSPNECNNAKWGKHLHRFYLNKLFKIILHDVYF